MDNEIKIPNCKNCGAKLVKHPHKDYYVCPNWKPNNAGCEGDIWWPNKKKNYPNVVFSVKMESKSNPGHYYQVKFYEGGDIHCGCVASEMGKFCRHKREAIELVEGIIAKIKKENQPGRNR